MANSTSCAMPALPFPPCKSLEEGENGGTRQEEGRGQCGWRMLNTYVALEAVTAVRWFCLPPAKPDAVKAK